MFELELNEDSLLLGKVVQEALLCFRKLSQKRLLVNWHSDIHFGISSKNNDC